MTSIKSCQLKKYFLHKSINRIPLLGVLLWKLLIIMYLTKHNFDVTLKVWTKITGKIFLQYFIQWRKNASVLIREISGYLENLWYFSTKLGLFQNLWALSQYTRAYHVCQREYYILHIQFYSIWCFYCL